MSNAIHAYPYQVVTAFGRDRRFCLTIGSYRKLEELLEKQEGKPVNVFTALNFDQLLYSQFLLVFYSGLISDDPKLTIQEAEKILKKLGIEKARTLIEHSFLYGLTENQRKCIELNDEREKKEQTQSLPSELEKGVDWLNLWAIAIYDLKLEESFFWNLTFGQFYKLQDHFTIAEYSRREDIQDLKATLLNVNTKNGRYTAKDFIGSRPKLSDEIPVEQTPQDILSIFKRVMPPEKGQKIYNKPKNKKKKGKK